MNWENAFFWISIVAGLAFVGLRWLQPSLQNRIASTPFVPSLVLAPFALALGVLLAAIGPALWLSITATIGKPTGDLEYAWKVIPLAVAIYYHVALKFFLLPTVFFFLIYPPLSRRVRWFSGTTGVVLVALAVSLSNDFIGQLNGIPSHGGAAWLLLGGFIAALWSLPFTRPRDSSPSAPA